MVTRSAAVAIWASCIEMLSLTAPRTLLRNPQDVHVESGNVSTAAYQGRVKFISAEFLTAATHTHTRV